ncbi:MAG: tRNA lysidine(34) synthetase TilS C-terminal domain-containing protein, partial [Prevotella sp.]|nr:tRNA lysidine(34) synthetase TilS C-terminal domain-containing protein [Prevotella sp.]
LGMMHSRLVNDILADHHLDLFQRRRQLVVEQADGTLVWIVGLRICQTSRAYATTERVVSLSLA